MSLIAALFAALFAILFLIRAIQKPRPRPFWKKRKSYYSPPIHYDDQPILNVVPTPPKTPDIQQVLSASFQKKRLMNGEELELFVQLEKLIYNNRMDYRLFSQVSLGEIIYSNDRSAFYCINSKRCDFLVTDKFGEALVVIEYHGSGHFQGNSPYRDEVKRLALKKASIPTVEVLFGYNWIDVKNDLKKELGHSFALI